MLDNSSKTNLIELAEALLKNIAIYSVRSYSASQDLDANMDVGFTSTIDGALIDKRFYNVDFNYQIHTMIQLSKHKEPSLLGFECVLENRDEILAIEVLSLEHLGQFEHQIQESLKANLSKIYDLSLYFQWESRKFITVPFREHQSFQEHSIYKDSKKRNLTQALPYHIELDGSDLYCDAQVIYCDYLNIPLILSQSSYSLLVDGKPSSVAQESCRVSVTSLLLAVITKGQTEYLAICKFQNLETGEVETECAKFNSVSVAMSKLSELWFDRDLIYLTTQKYLPKSIQSSEAFLGMLNRRQKLVVKNLLAQLVTEPKSFTLVKDKKQIKWSCVLDIMNYDLVLNYEAADHLGLFGFSGADVFDEDGDIVIHFDADFLRENLNRHLVYALDKLNLVDLQRTTLRLC